MRARTAGQGLFPDDESLPTRILAGLASLDIYDLVFDSRPGPRLDGGAHTNVVRFELLYRSVETIDQLVDRRDPARVRHFIRFRIQRIRQKREAGAEVDSYPAREIVHG